MTETLYKLVRGDMTTRDGYEWTIGKRHRATGERGQGLCSDEYLHCYRSLEMAELLRIAHGIPGHCRALEVSGRVYEDDGTKVGVRQCVVIREVKPVNLTTKQRVAAAILCASRVYGNPEWIEWAHGWLGGRDRSKDSAHVAAAAYADANADANAAAAAGAAANAAADAAAYADAYADAAYSAANADAADAAYAAAYADAYRDWKIDIHSIICAVISTPESEWETLLEEYND